MKVQLVVVRGKPEGKVIPLVGSNFKIGRGETNDLRPNSEQVSREHAEFSISDNAVIVRDLGSRNGTLVNGKALTAEFRPQGPGPDSGRSVEAIAVSISDVPAPAAKSPAAKSPAAKAAAPASSKAHASPDDISGDEIDSWLFGEGAGASADQPTAVYGGDTITITAFKDASASHPRSALLHRPATTSSQAATRRRRGSFLTRRKRPTQYSGEAQVDAEAESEEFQDDITAEERRGRGGGDRRVRGVHRADQSLLRSQENRSNKSPSRRAGQQTVFVRDPPAMPRAISFAD